MPSLTDHIVQHDVNYALTVRGMFVQGWRSPLRSHVQKATSFVVHITVILL